MNRDLLMASVPHDQVRRLTAPPPFPQQGFPPFPLPNMVELVRLHPPPTDTKAHMLVSRQYDIVLYTRVAEYFHRFYSPSNPASKVDPNNPISILISYCRSQWRMWK